MSHSHNHRPDDEHRHASGRRGHPRHEAYRHAIDFDDDFDVDTEPRQAQAAAADTYESPPRRADSSS